MNLNKVFLMGHLTRDPELIYTSSNMAIAKFGLAINRKYKVNNETREDTCFVDITAWDKKAESVNKYLNKGKAVMIEGRLSFSSWETDDGSKRSKLEVVATTIQFLPSAVNDTKAPNIPKQQDSDNIPTIEDDIPF